MRKVIVNTTPLIALADIGQLELLHELYEEILIPEAVWEEVESEPAKTMVSDADWIKKVKITHTEEKRLFRAKLHAGEVEAIILADENAADLVIMDDNAAKKTAKFLGFRVTGTLGVIIKAKEAGLIDSVAPLFDRLIEDGLYIDERTRRMALKAAGEEE